jgi:hypothetical protein
MNQIRQPPEVKYRPRFQSREIPLKVHSDVYLQGDFTILKHEWIVHLRWLLNVEGHACREEGVGSDALIHALQTLRESSNLCLLGRKPRFGETKCLHCGFDINSRPATLNPEP